MTQETLEEFIEREGYPDGRTQDIWETGVRDGVEWQAQRMYSEEDMRKAFKDGSWVTSWSDMGIEMKYDTFEQWFEQFKK